MLHKSTTADKIGNSLENVYIAKLSAHINKLSKQKQEYSLYEVH